MMVIICLLQFHIYLEIGYLNHRHDWLFTMSPLEQMGELWRSMNIKQSYGDLPPNGQNRIEFWTNTRRNDLIVTGFFLPPLSYFPFTSKESKESNFGPFPKLGQILVSKWSQGGSGETNFDVSPPLLLLASIACNTLTEIVKKCC